MIGTRTQRLLALSLLLMSSAVGFGQATTRPTNGAAAQASQQNRFDNIAIRASGDRATSGSPAASQPADDVSAGGSLDFERVAFALGIVISLIFATRWASKKLFPGAVSARSSGAMKVMSRLVISPKQQLLMVQIGRRIVVVGDSAGNMAPVSEITDPDEVASLVAQLTDDKSVQMSRGFGSLFSRASSSFNTQRDAQDVDDDAPGSTDSPSDTEPVVSDARGEIHGLMEKVRLLSSQFRRSS